MANQQEVTLPQAILNRLLVVPDYQRPFAWEEKQLRDLWEDLDLLGSDRRHYAGTFVLRDLPPELGSASKLITSAGVSLHECEVVDGQQRLTTCFLLLDRIRRRLESLGQNGDEDFSEVAGHLRRTYGVVTVDKAPRPLLKLGNDLNDFWVDEILGDQAHHGGAPIAGQKRLREAAAYFDARLDGLTDGVAGETAASRLLDLQGRITDGLRFLVYTVDSMAEVGVIFETLNERGRELSDLEKAKNYLLYLARQIPDSRSDELAELINKAWSSIFSNLSRAPEGLDDQLLRAHWLATQNPDPREWKRTASIKALFERSKYIPGASRLVPDTVSTTLQDETWQQLYEDVDNYVRSLRLCSLFLAELYDDNAVLDGFGAGKQRALTTTRALRRSGVMSIFRPLLFAARLRRPKDAELYSDLTDMCERYAARVFVIALRRGTAGQNRLFTLAYRLYKGDKPVDILTELRRVLWLYADDDRVRAALESTKDNWYSRRGHKYFLYEYEMSLPKNAANLPDFSFFTESKGVLKKTTEHILPQNPDKDDPYWWPRFTLAQHASLRHTLGNLVLTYNNSNYSNKSFDKKKGNPLGSGAKATVCYAQAELMQERELLSYDDWTPENIVKRQQALAKWALQRWHVDPPAGTVVVVPEEEESDEVTEGSTEDEVVLAASLADETTT